MFHYLDTYISGQASQPQRLVLHLTFWIGYVLIFGFIWSKNAGDWQRSLLFELVALPPRMAAVYLSIYWLLPHFLLKKRYLFFLLGLGGLLFIAGLILRGLHYYFFPWYAIGKPTQSFWNTYQIIRGMVLVNATVIVVITIKVLKYWFQNQQQLKQSEQARIESELNYLKNQIHPHFFFNTLNNLYGLAIEKSDEAPDLILRLSQLMRYMLYETQTPTVPLRNEINHLHHYIALEKIRYQEGFQLMFQVKGEIGSQQIPPLLLLPFVENAFKHGLSTQIEHAWVHVQLEITATQLIFKVKNSIPSSPKSNTHPHQGLGLKNVRQRLDHLFEHRYELQINPEDTQTEKTVEVNTSSSIYSVMLTLPLTDMPLTHSPLNTPTDAKI
ncbi:MAG TPA: hypothetical protein DCS93_22870 [Microscillaceae bacterium]|nr:hypothetical protein [Microscillaceae bacterium]